MAQRFATGTSTYLRAIELDDADRYVQWMNDPEINRFLDVGRFPVNRLREEEWIKKQYAGEHEVSFAICLLENDQHIGGVGLYGISHVDRHGIAGILIGERSLHGKGLGTDALRTLLSYGFFKLNLNRIQLSVFESNGRAIACYRKLGFKDEGRLRQHRYRDGRYVDELVMAILREQFVDG